MRHNRNKRKTPSLAVSKCGSNLIAKPVQIAIATCEPVRRTRERILAEKDPQRLERWYERAIVAMSVEEVLDEPS